jgi:hypothetical protein
MDKMKNSGPKKKGQSNQETKGGKFIKYNPTACTKTITDLKTDKSTTVKMSRAECASRGGNEKPIPTKTPKQQAQKNAFTARAQRIKNAQAGN